MYTKMMLLLTAQRIDRRPRMDENGAGPQLQATTGLTRGGGLRRNSPIDTFLHL